MGARPSAFSVANGARAGAGAGAGGGGAAGAGELGSRSPGSQRPEPAPPAASRAPGIGLLPAREAGEWMQGWGGVRAGQCPEFRGQKAEATPNPDYWRGERPPVWGGGELGVERPPQRPLPSAEGYLPALPLQPGRLQRPRPGTPVLQALHPLILALGLAREGYPAHFPPLPSRGSVLRRPRVRVCGCLCLAARAGSLC